MNRRIGGIVREISGRTNPGSSYYTASSGERLMAALIAERHDLIAAEGDTCAEALAQFSATEQEEIRAAVLMVRSGGYG